MKRFIPVIVGLLFASLAGPILAQTQIQAQTQAKDFSKEFARFYELGLPVVTNATYVNLDAWGNFEGLGVETGLYELKLAGNAWMLKEDKAEGKGVFVKNYCRVLEVYDPDTLEKKQAAKLKEVRARKKSGLAVQTMANDESLPKGSVVQGRWMPVDPKQDLEKILVFLRKKNEEVPTRYDSLDFYGGYGALFLSAIHFHRMGFTNEADEIVALLFSAAHDQRKPIGQGLNHLADALYDEVARKFFQTCDWNRYDQDLQSLQARFGTVWEETPAIQRLEEKVKARAGQPQPPPLAGEGLTDEDRQLALELAVATNLNTIMQRMEYEVWILPTTVQHGSPDIPTNTLARIRVRGMQSIPLLLALLKDDILTLVDITKMPTVVQNITTQFHLDLSRPRFRVEENLTKEQLSELYGTLQRPASRSEIAIQLLDFLLIHDKEIRNAPGRLTREEISERIQNWYEEHKNQSLAELAWFYLKEGDDRQREQAGLYLIHSGNESNQAAIEEFFLEGDNPKRDLEMVQKYVDQRKEKAGEFLGRYEAMMKQQGFDANDEEWVKQSIADMKIVASAKPLEQILDEILTEKTTMAQSFATLHEIMGRKKADELAPLLLGAAVKAKTLDLRVRFIYMIESVPERGRMKRLDIKPAADLWKQLLLDTRVPEPNSYWDEPRSVAETAAWTIETLYGEKETDGVPDIWWVSDKSPRLQPLINARAEVRLAGKPVAELPPLPDADRVSAEQRKKIVEQVMQTQEADVDALIKTLSMDNLLALTEEVEGNEALNMKLADMANRVNTVVFKTLQGEPSKELDALKGQKLSKAMVEQALAVSRRLTEEGKPSWICIRRQSDLEGIDVRGLVLSTTNLPVKGGPYFTAIQDLADNKEAKVLGSAFAMNSAFKSYIQGSTIWAVDQKNWPTPEKKNATVRTNATERLKNFWKAREKVREDLKAKQLKEFWKAVEDLCAGRGAVSDHACIMFIGKPILVGAERHLGDD